MKQRITVRIGEDSSHCVLCDNHLEIYLKEVAQKGYSSLSISAVSSEDSECRYCQELILKSEE